jgi:DNA-directed RNA polymerase alpha subunit
MNTLPLPHICALPLDRFNLSTRTTNCTRVQMLATIGDLITKNAAEIMSWPNAGRKTLDEIRILLGRLGLKLTGDSAPTGAIDLKLMAELEVDAVELLSQINLRDGPSLTCP